MIMQEKIAAMQTKRTATARADVYQVLHFTAMRSSPHLSKPSAASTGWFAKGMRKSSTMGFGQPLPHKIL